jgi:hypothetical protein
MKAPSSNQIVAWSVAGVAIIAAVMPVLPPETPEWVRQTLGILAVILVTFTHKPGAQPPVAS